MCQIKEQLRSLWNINKKNAENEMDARHTRKRSPQFAPRKFHRVEGFLCQIKEQLRSLRKVNEEVAL